MIKDEIEICRKKRRKIKYLADYISTTQKVKIDIKERIILERGI
jgi:hypothetical protein